MTAPSTSSTNDANTAYPQVSTASPSVKAASPQVCTASVNDNIMYAFMLKILKKEQVQTNMAANGNFQDSESGAPEFKGYGPENSKQESNVVCDKELDNSKENSDESLVEEQVEFTKPENHEKPVKKSVRGKPQHDDKGFVDSGCLRHNYELEYSISLRFQGDLMELCCFRGSVLTDVFDKDVLFTDTECTISNDSAGTSEENSQDCIVMPIWKDTSYFDSPTKDVENGEPKTADDAQKQVEDGPNNENVEQERFEDDSSTKDVNVVEQVNTLQSELILVVLNLMLLAHQLVLLVQIEQDSTKEEPEVDLGNITNSYIVPTTPNTRIHKNHPIDNVIVKIEPTSIAKALSDSSWVEAMQEELLQFKLQQVWILVDLPNGKKVIATKWVFRNKKDEIGIVIRNKSRIEAIRLFLAYASFMGFLVYQMDLKSAFLYGTIKEEVYDTQPPGVVKALYGLHQAPRAWYETLANYVLKQWFKRAR
ncbi:putative ribonuclease H-like domain-containing protein [Tanacetum coccineum]|uniref:Ribonuclease H-like domain-containing protein n=1 Tax=Tanacetum coccineum TaxID=301880 RepID=A0ABQ5IRG3_9ASTR